MKKILMALALALAATVSQAQIDTSNLTQAQIQELQAKASEMSGSKAAQVSKEVRTELGAWGQMGTDLGVGLGRAIVSAAKEVGVAANEFAGTPLGKVATVVVVYKLIGQDILSILVGLPLLIVGVYYGIRIMRMPEKVEYDYIDRTYFWGAFTLRRKYVKEIRYANDLSAQFITGTIMILGAIVISCVIIF